jgi:hypothetical protein
VVTPDPGPAPNPDPVTDVIDTITGGGDPTPNPVKDVVDTVNKTVDKADAASGGTVGGVKDAATGAAGSSPVGNPLSGFDKGGKLHNSHDRPTPGHQTFINSGGVDLAAGTFKTEMIRRLDSKLRTEPAAPRLATSALVEAPESHTPLLTQLAQAAGAAAEKLAFPLALGLMVVAFLMVQGRIDRKDAKLALAPIDAEQELLSFQ